MFKRILSIALALVLVLSIVPATAATDNPNPHYFATALYEFYEDATAFKTAILTNLQGFSNQVVVAVKETNASYDRNYYVVPDPNGTEKGLIIAVFAEENGENLSYQLLKCYYGGLASYHGDLFISSTNYIVSEGIAGDGGFWVIEYVNGSFSGRVPDDGGQYGLSDGRSSRLYLVDGWWGRNGVFDLVDDSEQILAMTADVVDVVNEASIETDKELYERGEIINVTGIVSEHGFEHANFYLKNTTEPGTPALGAVERVTDTPPTASFQTSELPPGRYYIYVVAYFSGGEEREVKSYAEVYYVDRVTYSSADEAAIAFARDEYAATAYTLCERGAVIFSITFRDNERFFLADTIAGEPHGLSFAAYQDTNTLYPDLAVFAAKIHTHPNSNDFSGRFLKFWKGDIPSAKKDNLDSYVIVPELNLLKYDVASGKTSYVAWVLPRLLTTAERERLDSEFRLTWDSHVESITSKHGDCNDGFYCRDKLWPNEDYNATWPDE